MLKLNKNVFCALYSTLTIQGIMGLNDKGQSFFPYSDISAPSDATKIITSPFFTKYDFIQRKSIFVIKF